MLYFNKLILWGMGGCLWVLPGLAYAQFGVFQQDSLGFGLWLSISNVTIDPTPDSSPARVRGYGDVLPASLVAVGIGFGGNWKNFGADIGVSRGEVSVGKFAEIQQNEDPNDDLFVKNARRLNQSWSILHHPFSYIFYGYGENQGEYVFEVRLHNDQEQVKSVGYYHPYFIGGAIWEFELYKEPNPLYLLITTYVKIPRAPGYFSGTVYGIGITGAVP